MNISEDCNQNTIFLLEKQFKKKTQILIWINGFNVKQELFSYK